MSEYVKLGYAINDDEHSEVAIPIRHMVVAGQTQEAGKTTTLEALIARSGKTAIAFVTKRGEGSFSAGRRIRPYFRERADWQFVASILEATMREKMKFERSWIINASKGAKTLSDVHKNVKKALQSARGISEGVYTTLDAYLDIVVPRIAEIDFDRGHLQLQPGLNVMDLSDSKTFPSELQALVMRSAIEWVYQECNDTITIIPEAWEFLPQSRGSPVKLAAVELIRKGAGLRNYVWLDSQDIGGIDKEILRSCTVWLLGVQRENNEIKRTLSNIPDTTAKPKPAAIATLERGQFYACFGKHAHKTYVQPAWLPNDVARGVAAGTISPTAVISFRPRQIVSQTIHIDGRIRPAEIRKLAKVMHEEAKLVRPDEPIPRIDEDEPMSKEAEEKLDQVLELLHQQRRVPARSTSKEKPAAAAGESAALGVPVDNVDLYMQIRSRLLKDPKVLQVLAQQPTIEIRETLATVELDGNSLRGRLALLISKGFFNEPHTANAAFDELKRRGFRTAKPNVYRECDKLAELGYLTKEEGGYQAVPDMSFKVVRS